MGVMFPFFPSLGNLPECHDFLDRESGLATTFASYMPTTSTFIMAGEAVFYFHLFSSLMFVPRKITAELRSGRQVVAV